MGVGFLVLGVSAFAVGAAGATDADGAAHGLGALQGQRVAASTAAGGFVVDGTLYAASGVADIASADADALNALITRDALVFGAAAGGFWRGAVGVFQAARDAEPVLAHGAVSAALRVFEALHAASRVRVADRRVAGAVRVAATSGDAERVFAERLVGAALRVVIARHALPAVGIAVRSLRMRQALRVEITGRAGPELQVAKGKAQRAVQVLRAGDDGVVFGEASRSAPEDCARDQARKK